MYRKVSIILAIIALIINSSLSGQYLGFDKGYHEAIKSNVEISFSGGNITVYTILFEYYQPIVLLLIVFLIGKLIKKEFLSQIISFSTLSWIIYLYWQIYLIKNNLFTPNNSFTELIRDTIPLDWFCFLIVLILLVIQVISVYKFNLDWKLNDNKVK